MKLRCTILAGLLTLSGLLRAEEDPPNGPPPKRAVVKLSGSNLHVMTAEFQVVDYLVEKREVEVNGRKQLQEFNRPKFSAQRIGTVVEPADFRVITVGGTRLTADAIQDLFAKDANVLLVEHGKPLDPCYTAYFNPDVPVVYLRSHEKASADGHVQPPAPRVADKGPIPQVSPSAPDPVADATAIRVPSAPALSFDAEPRFEGPVPRPAWRRLVDGKPQLALYDWRAHVLWRNRTITKAVQDPEGIRETVSMNQRYGVGVWEPVLETHEIISIEGQLFDAVGNARPMSALTELLAQPFSVMLLPAGQTPDPVFLKFLKPGVVIIAANTTWNVDMGDAICTISPINHFARIEGDQLQLGILVEKRIQKVEPYLVEVDGRQERRERLVEQPVYETVVAANPLDAFQAMLASGEKLAAARLKTLLSKSTQVIMVIDGPHVPPKLLDLYKPDTIFLMQKPAAAPAQPVPAPAPAPST